MTLSAISTITLGASAVQGAIALWTERQTLRAALVAFVKTETSPERIVDVGLSAVLRVLSGERVADVAESVAEGEIVKAFSDGIDSAERAIESLEHIETTPLGPNARIVDELPPDTEPQT